MRPIADTIEWTTISSYVTSLMVWLRIGAGGELL
jgi:hypothetical protein